MSQNERTSDEVAALAGRILGGGEYSDAEVRRLAACVLTQAADRAVETSKRQKSE